MLKRLRLLRNLRSNIDQKAVWIPYTLKKKTILNNPLRKTVFTYSTSSVTVRGFSFNSAFCIVIMNRWHARLINLSYCWKELKKIFTHLMSPEWNSSLTSALSNADSHLLSSFYFLSMFLPPGVHSKSIFHTAVECILKNQTLFNGNWFSVVLQNKLVDWQAWNQAAFLKKDIHFTVVLITVICLFVLR